jgi:hypothetical protein
MEPSGISDGVRELIRQHITSVAQLEALLLIAHANPDAWSAADIARELRIESTSAGQILADLGMRGFLEKAGDDTWRFSSAAPQLHALVQDLGAAYHERRVAVITLIFSKPPDPVRQFAEAFRLKKGTD